MRLSAPKQVTWLIAVILGVVALLSFLGVVPQLTAYTFWMMTIAWAVLVLATLLHGL
jgi:hypothetical protein